MANFLIRHPVAGALILALLLPVPAFALPGGALPEPPAPAPLSIPASEPGSAAARPGRDAIPLHPSPPVAEAADAVSSPSAPTPELASDPAGRGAPTPGWRWRRAGAEHYLGVAVVGAAAFFVESKYGKPGANWKSRNEFDESVRDLLRLGGRDDRKAAHTVGDVLMWGMIAAPVLDAAATIGVRDGDWDTLWQTEMVNLESFALTSFVSALMQDSIGREKPFKRNCRNGACEGDQENRSMASGHVAFALTGAGLVCNHHSYQSLYRDPAADRAACLTGIGLAAADGVARIMADHHYATDVMVGAAIGWFSGFVLPRLLHYNHPIAPPQQANKKSTLARRWSLRPMLAGNATGLGWELRF